MKRTLSLVLSLVLFCSIFSCLSVTVNAASASDCLSFYWESDKSYVTSCKTTASGSLVIPSTHYSSYYGYKPVIGIRSDAFKNCTKLTSITIPSSITSIASSAFEGCTSLTSITVDSENEYFSSADGVLFNKDMTTLIRYPIGKTATSFTIPNTVTNIGEYAFSGCTNLTSITIPDTVTHIGYNAFDNTGYYNDSANWVKGVLYINNHLIKAKTSVVAENIIKEGTITIADEAFADCIGLTSITIPDSVTNIGKYAFEGCTSLTSITIPDSVTSIGEYAFYDCTSLNAVYITDIAKWCSIDFDYISNPLSYANNLYLNGELVTDLVIPDSITSIGHWAFYNCTSLESVIIPDSVTSIGNSAFRDCTSLTSITIPDNVTSIGESAFSGCISLTSITIPDSVTSIGDYAFSGCTNFQKIYWNAKNISPLTTSSKIFSGVGRSGSGIEVVFGDTVEKIPAYLFYVYDSSYRPKVTKVTIGENVTSIGDYAFCLCTSLTSITVPDSVTSIGSYAFNGCTGLKSVTVGKGVTNIGSYAFSGCTSLENAYYRGLLIDWGDIAVGDGNSCLLDATFSHLCTYNDWIIDNIASCSETGLKHRICLVCGETVTEEIPTISHTPSDWKIDTPATVEIPGSKHIECTVCGTRLETATIPQLKPETPKVKAVNTLSGMKVTWNAVDGAVKYGLYKRLGTANTWTFVTTTTATSYADNNASYAGSYYVYTVKAYNSEGTPSDYIKANCASVQRVIAPYTNAKNALDGINVTWNKVSGANKYVVLRRIGTESTWKTLCTTTASSFLDKNVTPGIYYVYSIRAVNNTGYSEYDVNKRITVQRVVAPYTKAANTVNGINVTWGKVAGANKYVVLRRIGTESTWKTLCTTTGTSYLDKNVTPGIYYVYSIRAVNNTGYSEYDVNKRVTIKRASYKPDTPTVVATNLTNGVQIKWNSVKGATKYNVYRRRAHSNTWVCLGTTTGTLFIDKDILIEFSCVYSVRAYNSNGFYSEYDANKTAINFWVGTPTVVAKNTTDGVQIKWNHVHCTEYKIYRRVGGSSNWTLIGEIPSYEWPSYERPSFVDKNVKKGTYYVYSVRAVMTVSDGPYSYSYYEYISAYDSSKCASIKHS